MTDQELFDKLKRDGECWHEFPAYTRDSIEYPGQQKCVKCGKLFPNVIAVLGHPNPDFTTPDGFFWLWERAKEQDWWDEFCNASPHKAWLFSICWINPTRFTEALKQYLSKEVIPNASS